MPDEIYVPLTLASIGTTILALGQIHAGSDKHLYWSNRMVRAVAGPVVS